MKNTDTRFVQEARRTFLGRRACSVLAALLLAAGTNSVSAQSYPDKPIRVVVPFPGGGGSDVVARIVGVRLGERLAQPVVVDNRPGAAGIIGTDIVSKAAADGYTLLLASGSHSINAAIGRRLPYDPIADFSLVSRLALIPNVLVVHPAVPAKSVKELIALARAKPGQVNYASAGSGSTQHLAMELLKAMAKVDLTHIPYKGASPAETDLLAGRVQVMFGTVPATVPHAKAGTLRAIAVSSARRTALMPDLPTVAEAGLPGFEVESWYGLMAPKGLSAAVTQKLNREVKAVLETPEVRDRLALSGAETVSSTPQEFAGFVKAEIAKWRRVVRSAGIRLE